MGRENPRVVVISSQSSDSGSGLRAGYIASSLKKAGCKTTLIKGVKAMPFMLDYLLTLFLNLRLVFMPMDVIVGLKPYPNITLLMLIKKAFGVKTIIDIDDLDFGYRLGFISKINHLLQKPFPKHFTAVTYHTAKLRDFIINNFSVDEDKLYRLKQGVDFSVYKKHDYDECRKSILKESGFGENSMIVAYTAHLNIASDLEEIFKIISKAQKFLPQIRFLVIGGGPMENYFRNLAKNYLSEDSIHFTGYVLPNRVAKYLSGSQACVVYYRDIEVNYYRESMKLREMLGLGKKIVCNSIGDLKDFSKYTYQADDFDSLAKMLCKVLEGFDDSRQEKGFEYVRDEMDWDKIGYDFMLKIKSCL